MLRYINCFLIALSLTATGWAQSYGLMFNSHEVVLEKRTSLDLSPSDSFCFRKNFDLSFELSFKPNHQVSFGYVLRMICGDQNVDLMYNQPTSSFNIVVGESFSGISFKVDSLKLFRDWSKVNLSVDLNRYELKCFLNNKLIGTTRLPVLNHCFKFLWGANDYQKFKTRDIPPMKIKDIRIAEDKKEKYYWPLNEKSGDVIYDKISQKEARAKNPDWAMPKYQNWEQIASFTTNGYAGVAFDSKQDKLYITCADSMGVFTFGQEQKLDWVPVKHQNFLLAHQAIYDTVRHKLWDIYPDLKKVIPYDFKSRAWEYTYPGGPIRVTEYWHGNKFISTADSSLFFIGGYGYLRYKNLIQRYRFDSKKWDTLKPSGDFLPPKYLAALGTDPRGENAYIIGGYGSHSGDQMLDPRYYYDLFRYNVKENSFRRIYSFKPLITASTFANSLVIDPATNTFYGLNFSNDSYNSSLQLVKGSLTDSVLTLVGSPIPYNFHDVQSFADLYYSPSSNKLIAVTLFYSEVEAKELVDARVKYTDVKVFTLNFPPEPINTNIQHDTTTPASVGYWKLIVPALLVLGVGLIYFLRRKQPKLTVMDTPVADPVKNSEGSHYVPAAYQQAAHEKYQPSAIYLFGQFQVFDKEGNSITRLFTPLLKELLLVIIIYSVRNGRGISSESLNEILWQGKSDKDAGNNRSVNLAKLKVIFEKIGNCVINKDSGYWQFLTPDEQVYVDYKKYVSLLQSSTKVDKEFIQSLAEIVRRGPFLAQTEWKWLDDVKSEVSNSVVESCLDFIRSQDLAKDPELVVEITNYIFYFDQLNEDALTFRCKSLVLLKRHALANNSYIKFVKDYKEIYGEDFGKSFHEIIA